MDIFPRTGKWGRPYSKNCFVLVDIIFVATTHCESVCKLIRSDINPSRDL